MGVNELWKLFREEGLMREWSVETDGPGAQKAVAEQIEGKVVAVDISQWACNALTQQATADVWSEEGRVVKVAFDRAINLLRFGCTPVGVLDGKAPEAKLATLQARYFARFGREGGGCGNDEFISQCEAVAKLFRAMGLWVVQAPGEAEATCAALNQGGYVDACATVDSDVLLFGAETAFHTLRPLTGSAKECAVARLDIDRVREHLGISSGGHQALIAMALLLGGDYHMRGAEKIGPKQAFAVVKYLLQSHSNDEHVVQALKDFLQTPDEEHADIIGLDKCTGCKRCGHEGYRKNKILSHSVRNICQSCPSDEDNRCQAMTYEQCSCAFHRLEKQRIVVRALQRIKGSPDFVQDASTAHDAYQWQIRDAARAVHAFCERHGKKDRMTWQHRPDLGQMYSVISRSGIEWEEATFRRKAMPLLMEWDATQPHTQAEFVPTGIVKLHSGLKETCWRYLMTWKRTAIGSTQDRQVDVERLEAKGKTTDLRALRISTIQESWPQLAEAFEAKQRIDAAKKAGKPAKSAAIPDKATAGMAARMQAFLQPRSLSAPAKPATGLAVVGRGLGCVSGPPQAHPVSAPAACPSDKQHSALSQEADAWLQSPPKTPSKRRPARNAQAAGESRQGQAHQHLSFASPGKRFKTPPASPAVHVIASSPEAPELQPASTQAPQHSRPHNHGRSGVSAALAAISGVIEGSCAVEVYAHLPAAAESRQRAGTQQGSTSGLPVQHAAAARHEAAAQAQQSSQGVSTPAKQPQIRQRYVAGNTSTVKAGTTATGRGPAKSRAQAAMSSRPINSFFAESPAVVRGPFSSTAGHQTPMPHEVVDLSQASPELQTPQIPRDTTAVVPTPSTGPDTVLDLVTPPSSQRAEQVLDF